MPNVNTYFNAKNGLGTANVLVIDSSQNLTNVQAANMVSLNVSANISNVGNLAVTQNASFGNISTTNLSVTYQIAQFANCGVYVNGTLVANNPNINFVASNTSNLNITGTSNTNPGNVTITFDTRVPSGGPGGGQPPGAPNLSMQVNVAGTFTGTANVLLDTVGNNMYVEGNIQLANASTLNFGGKMSNVANAWMALSWNVTSNSLDFLWG